jgi:DNA-binding CsgD family transcriptional regulator
MGGMLDIGRVRSAVDGVMAAAFLGDGWEQALAGLARATDARHAVLMRNTPRGAITSLSNEEAWEPIADYMAGKVPPNPRYLRVNLGKSNGFRVDHDDYTDDELRREPYYQEFLRPNGVFWHANAVLAPGHDEYVELSLKRGIRRGPYQPDDLALMNGVLGDLNAAARIAKATLDAELRGMKRLLAMRGELIVEIDRRGMVLRGQWPGEADPLSPLRVAARRLRAAERADQRALDRAVAEATEAPQRMALAPLTGPDGRRWLLQVHPVPGRLRDIFLSATAIAVLIERDRNAGTLAPDTLAIREAFGLTAREAEVACLLGQGLDVPAIARRLNIRPDTARTYLRDVYCKTGTRRQTELVALLERIAQ